MHVCVRMRVYVCVAVELKIIFCPYQEELLAEYKRECQWVQKGIEADVEKALVEVNRSTYPLAPTCRHMNTSYARGRIHSHPRACTHYLHAHIYVYTHSMLMPVGAEADVEKALLTHPWPRTCTHSHKPIRVHTRAHEQTILQRMHTHTIMLPTSLFRSYLCFCFSSLGKGCDGGGYTPRPSAVYAHTRKSLHPSVSKLATACGFLSHSGKSTGIIITNINSHSLMLRYICHHCV